MCNNNYITKREKGKHLTAVERGKISSLLKLKVPKRKIAEEIGVSERTIYREIKRGMVKGLLNSDLTTRDEYVAEYAQNDYDIKKYSKEGCLKIGNNIKLAKYLEHKMKYEKYSPTAAIYQAKKDGYEVNFCVKTLYNYIENEIFLELTKKDLPYKKERRKKRKDGRTIRKQGGKSIEDRAKEISERNTLGHWEMDTVVGGRNKSKACLLVLTERLSRKEIIMKIDAKDSNSVTKALIKLKNKYPKTFNKRFLTITVDNGSEFMDAKSVEEMGISLFYAHSYCSWERGSNENANRLIRRFVPKGADIGKFSHKYIKQVERWINDYPRDMFDGMTSNDVYMKHLMVC